MKPYLVTTATHPFKRLVVFAKDALEAFRKVEKGTIDGNPWAGEWEYIAGETAHSSWPINAKTVLDLPQKKQADDLAKVVTRRLPAHPRL